MNLSRLKMKQVTKQKGFSLIEIMVVVVIIAILAAIALPAYAEYVRQARVAEATSELSDLRIKAEQYFQDNLTYVDFPCVVPPGATPVFAYACPVLTDSTYTLSATGNNNMAGFVYTINQDNQKTSDYGGAGVQNCWTTRKGQSC